MKRTLTYITLIIAYLIFSCNNISSQVTLFHGATKAVTGKVIKVSDGDTFTLLMDDNKKMRIRLHGIDAPEMKGSQPYCKVSKEFLEEMIAGKWVSVDIKSIDRYKRYIGMVRTKTIKDVNLEMLKAGMAWHYNKYDHTPSYYLAEKKARLNKIGLWKDKKPINPAQWRKKRK